jgi:hypothetical protein
MVGYYSSGGFFMVRLAIRADLHFPVEHMLVSMFLRIIVHIAGQR